MPSKIAVVTGSNKGIGFGIVKGLCEKFDGRVYLTSRHEGRGQTAVNELKSLDLNPSFHQLDIDNEESVKTFRNHIKAHEGGIDVLVNNAAIAFQDDTTDSFGIRAEVTLATNYFNTLRACEILFPLLRPNAQVVNLTSALGHLSQIPSAELRGKLSDPSLTIGQLNELMNQFIRDAKNNKHIENGWGASSYAVSKAGVSALSIIQQSILQRDNRNISVNHVHPGYVDTDMTSHKGFLTVEQGASAPLLLALGGHHLKGQCVWFDSSVVNWYGPLPDKSILNINAIPT
ncbi:carbonyl reductase [NADPH] 3-like [Photinus pyralis]|uniref:carbonyl reductase [NADPH] 3-like n=1 Tax=Photinus pyralis TaxID=7054 RepID=UPI001267078D|nr:carbonyl reductase [NADPH] 3-like [Photinus pyralis]